jgi:MioC protein
VDEVAQRLTILIGTMTGTAQLVADELVDALQAKAIDAEAIAMDGLDAGILAQPGLFLFCTSTYGQGDVPDNAQKLFADLERTKPDLAGITYGMIALGDRTYAQTFCQGGKRFDALLQSLGAVRIGDMLLHDASAGTIPEEIAVAWIADWAEKLPEARDKAA